MRPGYCKGSGQKSAPGRQQISRNIRTLPWERAYLGNGATIACSYSKSVPPNGSSKILSTSHKLSNKRRASQSFYGDRGLFPERAGLGGGPLSQHIGAKLAVAQRKVAHIVDLCEGAVPFKPRPLLHHMPWMTWEAKACQTRPVDQKASSECPRVGASAAASSSDCTSSAIPCSVVAPARRQGPSGCRDRSIATSTASSRRTWQKRESPAFWDQSARPCQKRQGPAVWINQLAPARREMRAGVSRWSGK